MGTEAETDTVTISRALYEEVLVKLRSVAARQDEARLLREQVDALYRMDAVERGMVFYNHNHDPHNGEFTGSGAGGAAETTRETGRGRRQAAGTTRQRAPRQSGQSRSSSTDRTGSTGGTRGTRARADRSASVRTQTPAERELEAATHEHEAAKRDWEESLRVTHDAAGERNRAARDASGNGHAFEAARQDLRQQELARAATRAPRSYQRMLEQRAKAEELKQEAIKASKESDHANYRLGKMYVDKREAGMTDAQIKRDPEHRDALREARAKQQIAYRAGNKASMADYGARQMEDRLIGERVTREAIDAHPLMQQAQREFEAASAAHDAAIARTEEAGQRVDAAAAHLRQARGALDLERGGPGIEYEPDADAEKSWRGVFGRDFSTSDLAKLSGAGLGDKVSMSEGGPREVAISVEGHINRSFTVSRTGRVVTLVDGFTGNEGKKTSASGAELIHGMENMHELGVTRIQCTAARSSTMNGYYTWAKLGFTGRIPGSRIGQVHRQFGANVNHIEQLMGTKAGSNWWKQHGDDWGATFDFRNSYSMGRLNDFKRILSRHEQSGEGA